VDVKIIIQFLGRRLGRSEAAIKKNGQIQPKSEDGIL